MVGQVDPSGRFGEGPRRGPGQVPGRRGRREEELSDLEAPEYADYDEREARLRPWRVHPKTEVKAKASVPFAVSWPRSPGIRGRTARTGTPAAASPRRAIGRNWKETCSGCRRCRPRKTSRSSDRSEERRVGKEWRSRGER